MKMASFLTIPQEIRDTILEIAISAGIPPPKDPAAAGKYAELNDIKYKSWLKGKNVLYPEEPVTSTALPLLLVSRGIHTQTLAAITRVPPTYTFDVMLVREHQLWATWTLVPKINSKLDYVHTVFRMMPSNTTTPRGYAGFRAGDAAPPALYWQLYSLLERSLQCGPVGSGIGSKLGITSIQVLALDIQTPADIPEDRYIYGNMWRREAGAEFVISPRYWLDFVRSGVQVLLSLRRNAAPLGRILYEKVGKIRIMLDGEMQDEMDLAEILSGIKYFHRADIGYPKSRSRWVSDMKKLYRAREEAG
jgi:hypothetical protein